MMPSARSCADGAAAGARPGRGHRGRALDELDTGWLLLDSELLPWSAKAGGRIRDQYAAVGAAAGAALAAATARGVDVAELTAGMTARAAGVTAFREAYRRYCWPTDGLTGVQLAPFQVLAAEGATFHTRAHNWHLAVADRLHEAGAELFRRTASMVVDTTDEDSPAAGTAWWVT
jgi:protein phosphatase